MLDGDESCQYAEDIVDQKLKDMTDFNARLKGSVRRHTLNSLPMHGSALLQEKHISKRVQRDGTACPRTRGEEEGGRHTDGPGGLTLFLFTDAHEAKLTQFHEMFAPIQPTFAPVL